MSVDFQTEVIMRANFRQCTKAIVLMMAFLMSGAAQAERTLLDQVVAVVNDSVILQSELDARINTIVGRLRSQGTNLPPRAVLEERVLEQLITESIQLQMSERAGMRISDNELNETLASIASRNNMTLAQFENQLAQEGVSYQEAREQIRSEMLTGRVQQRQVGNRVRVTEREIDNYLEATAGQRRTNAEYELAHILIQVNNFNDEEEVAAARTQIESLRSEIADGRDFRSVAVAESDAGNALDGGNMGWRAEGQLPSLVADIVPEMEVGAVSPVLENSSGFHLVTVLDNAGAKVRRWSNSQRSAIFWFALTKPQVTVRLKQKSASYTSGFRRALPLRLWPKVSRTTRFPALMAAILVGSAPARWCRSSRKS